MQPIAIQLRVQPMSRLKEEWQGHHHPLQNPCKWRMLVIKPTQGKLIIRMFQAQVVNRTINHPQKNPCKLMTLVIIIIKARLITRIFPAQVDKETMQNQVPLSLGRMLSLHDLADAFVQDSHHCEQQ
ncbi:hypothetical protein O181_014649 [Austropuccinia psidii MF-1]|uniref:Uncharacterized protein n=1 Tax=Austropuccinia psidii MF-1 TaxID=1389203 RepID=A0A9Q3C0H2_9BASI|nr:hypothetical protein [Austropuccinia psidii MF-1]